MFSKSSGPKRWGCRVMLCLSMALVFAVVTPASADVSLTLGSVLPGWDKADAGPLHDSAGTLARSYAQQLGRTCFRPEVFVRDNTSSLVIAKVFYEPYLPYGSNEQVLLDDVKQRVSIVTPQVGAGTLTVMVALDHAVVLIVCQ